MNWIAENTTLLLSLGGLIIIGLAAYAGKLLLALKKQTETHEKIQSSRLKSIGTSITTICDATLQQQCSVSEATIRIVTLMQLHPALKGKFDEELSQMQAFYNKIEHHPILENRKQTPKKVLHKLDAEREELEAQFESSILEELDWLRTQAVFK